ncbi:MAG TPA: efflux RND transporter periplasmic adaptor subunit [Vicinamibacteria bacterium]|nr:efflux RND transporter periplasmic adaptor subunit [Vicinamibacteria bacterium]
MTDLKGELATLKIDRTRRKSSPWRWPLLLLAPVVVVLLVLYALRAQQAFSATEVETTTVVVSRDVAPSAGTPILTASGYVVARRKAVVSAKIQGRLSDLRVEEGSVVREGEVLARLESFDYEASVVRARAALQRAEADLAENVRQLKLSEDLAAQKIVSVDQRDAAASRVKLADAALAQAKADLGFAEAQLQNTVIRAPFGGVVVKKMAEVGESVAPIPPGVNISTSSGAIVALADLATLEVEADVAEANVAKVANGQPAEVTVEAIPDRRYKAILRQVIPTADRTKATVMVKVTILDKDKDLKPEMSAKVTFLEPEKNGAALVASGAAVVLVPRDSVVTRDGKPTVFLVREGKATARTITLGTERQGQVIVREGLSGGETLVARPKDDLKDGATVKVRTGS